MNKSTADINKNVYDILMASLKAKKPKPIHHAEDFGLVPLSGDDDLFRWFLMCFMLGKPIKSTVAVNTWQIFIYNRVDTPWAILQAGNHKLVQMLHAGKYTRYQHVMARSLQTCAEQLINFYDGSLMLMLESSQNEDEFNKRLQTLHGVGPKTAQIIMRETQEYFAQRVE